MQSTDIAAEILRNLTPLSAFRSRLTNKTTVSGWKEHKLLEKHRDAVASYQVLSVDTLLVQSAKTNDVDLCRFALARDAVTWQKAFDTAIQHGNVDVAKEIHTFAMNDTREFEKTMQEMCETAEDITKQFIIVHDDYQGKLDIKMSLAIKSNNMESFRYVFGLMRERVVTTHFLDFRCDNLGLMLEYALERGNTIDGWAEKFFTIGVEYKSEKIMAAAREAGAPEKSVEYFEAACLTFDVEWAKKWKEDVIDWLFLTKSLKNNEYDYRKVTEMLIYLSTVGLDHAAVLDVMANITPIDVNSINTMTAGQTILLALRLSDVAAVKRCVELGAVVSVRVMQKFLKSKLAQTKDGVEILQLLLTKLCTDVLYEHGREFILDSLYYCAAVEIVQIFVQHLTPYGVYGVAAHMCTDRWAQIQPICDYLRDRPMGDHWIHMALSTNDTEAYDYVAKHCTQDDIPTLLSYRTTHDYDIRRWFERFDAQKR